MPRVAAVVIGPPTPCCASTGRADAETTRLPPKPCSTRHRRSAGLMMPSDLDTADLPDTPYQSSARATLETRSPSELALGLLALFVRRRHRTRCLLRNNGACASLIGQCTSTPMSLTRVVGCASTTCLSCYHKRVAIGYRHFVECNKNICRSTLLSGKTPTTVNMNSRRSRAPGNVSPSSDNSSDSHRNN